MRYKRGEVLNRKLYKDIKKMDRIQMETYVFSLYEQGYNDGRASVPGIDLSKVREIILSVKGIGDKRADEIIRILEEGFKDNDS